MIRPFLIGLVAGQRGITPLAAIAAGTRTGDIPVTLPLQGLLRNPVVAAGTASLAAAEMAGDKMKSAPDRIVTTGLLVRRVTAAYAGAALAPPGRRVLGAAVTAGTAKTGFVEDALVLAAALAIASPKLVNARR